MDVVTTYDRDADIVWMRFPGYDGRSARTEENQWGLRDIDRQTGTVVALEFWNARQRFPDALLDVLPEPRSSHSRVEPATGTA